MPPKPQVFLKGVEFDALLETHNLTPAQAARFLGVSEALMSLWRSRKRAVSLEHRLKVLALFDVQFDRVFELVYPDGEAVAAR